MSAVVAWLVVAVVLFAVSFAASWLLIGFINWRAYRDTTRLRYWLVPGRWWR